MAFLIFFAFQKVSAQQINSVEIQVTGLTCSMCSQATEKSIRTLPYISNVNPDLNKNLFVLTFKNDKAVNFDQIQKKVKDAGFSVGNLQATMNFNQAKVDENGQLVVGSNVYQFVNVKNKVLNGQVKINLIDKNFISGTEFKKKQTQVSTDSYASGTGMVNGKKTRIYHVSI